MIPDGSMVLGVPGRVVRTLDDDSRTALATGATHYVENWRRYAAGLKPQGS